MHDPIVCLSPTMGKAREGRRYATQRPIPEVLSVLRSTVYATSAGERLNKWNGGAVAPSSNCRLSEHVPGWHDGAVRIATIQRSHAQVSVEAKADVLTVRGHSLPGVQTLFAREGSMRLLEDLSECDGDGDTSGPRRE